MARENKPLRKLIIRRMPSEGISQDERLKRDPGKNAYFQKNYQEFE
jgi:hypothetical protein